MSNVNTLNNMKKIFKDLCPVLEGQEKEPGKHGMSKAKSMRTADGKRRNPSKDGTAA